MAERVTDYQALVPVWLECDQCVGSGPKLEKSLQELPSYGKSIELFSASTVSTERSEINNVDEY